MVDTLATFYEAGTYTLTLEADDSELTGSDEAVVTVEEPAPTYPECWDYDTQCHGDTDDDGDVDPVDKARLNASMFFCYPAPEYDACADCDRDGCVDTTDEDLQDEYFPGGYPPGDCPHGGVWPPGPF